MRTEGHTEENKTIRREREMDKDMMESSDNDGKKEVRQRWT